MTIEQNDRKRSKQRRSFSQWINNCLAVVVGWFTMLVGGGIAFWFLTLLYPRPIIIPAVLCAMAVLSIAILFEDWYKRKFIIIVVALCNIWLGVIGYILFKAEEGLIINYLCFLGACIVIWFGGYILPY